MLINRILDDILKHRWDENGIAEYSMEGSTDNAEVYVKIVVHLQTLTFNMHKYTSGRYDSVYDVVTEMMADYLERIEIAITNQDGEHNMLIEPELSNEIGEVWWGSWKAVLSGNGEVMLVDKRTVEKIIFGVIIDDPVRIIDTLSELWIPIDRDLITALMEKGCEHVNDVDLCYEITKGGDVQMYVLEVNGETFIVRFMRSPNEPRWIAYIYEPKWIKRIDL